MRLKATLMDESAVSRALRRISFEIVERNHGSHDVCLVGIKRRGTCIAKSICRNIEQTEGLLPPNGVLDITLYRDDLKTKFSTPVLNDTDIPFPIDDKIVVLCDDVIYTGRTVRAAIDALFSLGRPKAIQLAVLIDRGHRELPIKPDFVGKNVPTARNEIIRVTFPEYDGCDVSVRLYERDVDDKETIKGKGPYQE